MTTKEKPILFSGPMVRAILEDRKTQTRRIVKPQPDACHDGEPYWYVGGYRVWANRPASAVPLRAGGNQLQCPYGQPGDRLWVRETWCVGKPYDTFAPSKLPKPTTKEMLAVDYLANPARMWHEDYQGRWRPSIHMPRWASRLTLEITAVRVERLQDISEADAKAEGCEAVWLGRTAKSNYCILWESINGPGSWALNPYVWVITFKRL